MKKGLAPEAQLILVNLGELLLAFFAIKFKYALQR